MEEVKNTIVRFPEHAPDKEWMKWTGANLPSSENLWISDLDSVLRTRNGCVVLIEIKRFGKPVPTWQKQTYGLLAATLTLCEGKQLNHPSLTYPIKLKKFIGTYELTFEKTGFHDGKVYLAFNGGAQKEVTEQEVKDIFSMKAYCTDCFPCGVCMSCKKCIETFGDMACSESH